MDKYLNSFTNISFINSNLNISLNIKKFYFNDKIFKNDEENIIIDEDEPKNDQIINEYWIYEDENENNILITIEIPNSQITDKFKAGPFFSLNAANSVLNTLNEMGL